MSAKTVEEQLRGGYPDSRWQGGGGLVPGGRSYGPLPRPGGMQGIGSALMQDAGGGGGVRGAVDGAGRHVKGALDWLTDEEQGAGRINAIGTFIGAAGGVYGAHKDRQMWAEEMERREREAEEEKKRRAGYGPMVGSVLERMMSSANGGGG